MKSTDIQAIAESLLVAMRAEHGGGMGPYEQTIDPNTKGAPLNITGSRIYVTSAVLVSTPATQSIDFAPFTILTDTGAEILVTRPYTEIQPGAFKRLTIKNPDQASQLKVDFFAGYGSMRSDAVAGTDPQLITTGLAAASFQFQRPNNVVAYAAGQNVGANPAVNPTFTGLSRSKFQVGSFRLKSLLIEKTGSNIANASFSAYFFTRNNPPFLDQAAFTLPAQGAPFSPPSFLGAIDIPAMRVESAGGSAWGCVDGLDKLMFAQGNTIWFTLVAQAAYVPAANETFTVTAFAGQ